MLSIGTVKRKLQLSCVLLGFKLYICSLNIKRYDVGKG